MLMGVFNSMIILMPLVMLRFDGIKTYLVS